MKVVSAESERRNVNDPLLLWHAFWIMLECTGASYTNLRCAYILL